MRTLRVLSIVAALAAATSLATTLRAGGKDCCCAHCGCHAACGKVCRLVCEEKKVEVICWGCQCEEFCLAGPSCPGCKHCEDVCVTCDEPCDPEKPQAKAKRFVWTDWCPSFAEIHVKKKLMKKVVTKKVPSYKWVVEDLCPDCAAKADDSAAGNKTTAASLEAPAIMK